MVCALKLLPFAFKFGSSFSCPGKQAHVPDDRRADEQTPWPQTTDMWICFHPTDSLFSKSCNYE
jgi:hypothetical protein